MTRKLKLETVCRARTARGQEQRVRSKTIIAHAADVDHSRPARSRALVQELCRHRQDDRDRRQEWKFIGHAPKALTSNVHPLLEFSAAGGQETVPSEQDQKAGQLGQHPRLEEKPPTPNLRVDPDQAQAQQ